MSQLRDPAHRVSPRARLMWQVETGITALVVVVGIGVAAVLLGPDDLRWWLVALAVVVCATVAVVVPRWRYAVHRWEVSANAVYTQRGWWAQERRIAPMSRVQTVDLAQGPLARLFGLATVTVTTASAAGPLQIEGLDRPVALALVDELTRKADLAEGDAT
ncbi:PH domain-containing protein [Nocardioides nitrophenolicus]|uniref:PH domain-containing protein n=1 Tax=Nocardioides nitrophenolicus TaxID=60489 RepID=UPI0027DD7C10|nr:PH domain-containing protein [Nocardioides nitrophenolicus]MBM7519240.1 membrane protein YdbS with pleckstrin-like domain [Nocardioides nitrophenolicus]